MAAARVYPVPACEERKAAGYAVTVDGEAAPVVVVRHSAMPVNIRWPGHQRELDQTEIDGLVRFVLEGKAKVVVTAPRDFREVKIRPLSRNVKPRVEGRQITFEVTRPGAYSVELDGIHENLHVFAETPPDYRVDKSMKTRYYGPGEHDAGVIELKSGETLFLDEGAVVFGRVHARDADHIRILGRGILDMSRIREQPVAIDPKLAAEQKRKGFAITNVKRWDAIRLEFCDDVKIDGIVIRDSLCYNIRPIGCRGLEIGHVKIIGNWRYNSDGIDMHNCENVHIHDCFLRTFDDAICVKGFDYRMNEADMLHDGHLHNVFTNALVERCTVWCDWGRSLEFGAETRAEEIRDITFRDCDLVRCTHVACDVQNCDYADIHDVLFDDIRVELDSFPQADTYSASAKDFDPKREGWGPSVFGSTIHVIAEYSKDGTRRGQNRDITVRNLRVTGPKVPRVWLNGYDAEHRSSNIVFDGVYWNGREASDEVRSHMSVGKFADPPRFLRAWPLVTMRQMGTTTWSAEAVSNLLVLTERHPGCCDEFWFAEGLYRSGEPGEKRAGQIGSYAPLCEKARVDCGFQQGVTLGHGGIGECPGVAKMPDDAYQVGPDGKRSSIFCPTSPEVLAYEEAGAELYVRLGRLKSMWLDDDLRFGFCKTPVACFCPRCLALLNKKAGTNFSREEWAKRLSSKEKDDPLRAVWADFKAESLATFAAAAARGARKANPDIRMGYQSISSACIACGEDYRKILEALSDNWKHPVGIRPGHGYYMETNPRYDLPVKLLDVAREAERCRAYPGWKGSIAYEQENYPHYAMEKTPAACVLEAALALAVGCDAVTLYWYDAKYPEPFEHYEDFMRLTAAWRPYYARLSELAKRTHLGGVAHAPDKNLMTSVANTIPALEKDRPARHAANDWRLALMGVPVTVAEAGAKSFYADRDVPGGKHYSHVDWTKLLDKLDALPGGKVCVRLDKQAPVLVYPRVTGDDRTAAVTLCNTSIGAAQSLRVRIRRPLGGKVTLARPCEPDLELKPAKGEEDELLVTLPDLSAWAVATLFVG